MLRALTISFTLAFSCFAVAQKGDYHTTQDPDRQLYQDSAFAHGQRHGYEEGFHAADEDYQIGRPADLQTKMPRAKGYKAEFGDKKSYLRGFAGGFRAGYADSYAGHAFRTMKISPMELPQDDRPADAQSRPQADRHDFDMGVAEGYRKGYANSGHLAAESGIADSPAWRCGQQPNTAAFCLGYGAGYVLGKADNESIARLQKAAPVDLAKNTH